jgi:hypothetical protein
MAESSKLRNLVARSNEALALAKQRAERASREMKAKYRDEPEAVLVTWTQSIFTGGAWRDG